MPSSMAARRARAAASGSDASVSQRTATNRRAPAAIISPTVSGLTLPVTKNGSGELADASRRTSNPMASLVGWVAVGSTGPTDT